MWANRNQKPKEAALAMKGYFDVDNTGKLVLRMETQWFYQMQTDMIATLFGFCRATFGGRIVLYLT